MIDDSERARRPDIHGSTTPAYLVAKNCGVTLRELLDSLTASGTEILLDANRQPALRKTDIRALIIGR